MTARTARAILGFILIAASGSAQSEPAPEPPPAGAAVPGREVSLPPEEVKDTFFAYVLGIIRSGAEVDMDNEQMRAILVEFKSTLNVPFDLIARVIQHGDPETGVTSIELDFQRDVIIPVPFSILWYHPGNITSTRALVFEVRKSRGADPDPALGDTPVYDLALTQGQVLVDIDAWLEALFSAHIEDTVIRHIVFFKWQGDWMGLLQGKAVRSGKSKRAYFDFTRNAIMFPAPEALDDLGRELITEPVRNNPPG